MTDRRLRVLIVDDNDMNLKIIDKITQKLGCSTTCLNSGKKCIEEIYHHSYDLLFLDHMMPEMDGLQVLTEMKTRTDHKCMNTKVIVLTANTGEGMAEEYLEKGFDGYLGKPVSVQMIQEVLDLFLEENNLCESESTGKPSDKVTGHTNTEAFLHQYHIEYKTGLSFVWDDEEQYRMMADIFANDFEKRNEKMNLLMKVDTLSDYAILVHGLKGNARTLGATGLGGFAYAEELAAKRGDLEYITNHHEQLLQEWKLVTEGFCRYTRGI